MCKKHRRKRNETYKRKNETHDTQTIRVVADFLGSSALRAGNSNSRVGFVLCTDVDPVDHGGGMIIMAAIVALVIGYALGSAGKARIMNEHYNTIMLLQSHRMAEKEMIEIIDREHAPFRDTTVNCAKCGKFVSMQKAVPVVTNKKELSYLFYHRKCLEVDDPELDRYYQS